MVFDSLSKIGGQPQMLYPFKKIFDIPAHQEITGAQLTSELTNGLINKITIHLNTKVTDLEQNDNGFIVNNSVGVKTIIIATGNGAFKPRQFPIKTTAEENQRIHYFIDDPQKFANQTIGIFGGGDSALDWALELGNLAKIELIHRRDNFRGLESSVEQIKQLSSAKILTPYLPKSLSLMDNKIEVELKKVGGNESIIRSFDHIIVAYGFKADNRFVKKWDIELHDNRIAAQSEMKTNVPGIYAIGDVVTYPGRVPIIGVGFGEAQIAITSIMRNLFPQKSLTIHSTSL